MASQKQREQWTNYQAEQLRLAAEELSQYTDEPPTQAVQVVQATQPPVLDVDDEEDEEYSEYDTDEDQGGRDWDEIPPWRRPGATYTIPGTQLTIHNSQ